MLVHARYSRVEILAALGAGENVATPAWREGVKKLDTARADVFVITLDKSDSGFSPTTRYRDYALSAGLFHWESQSMTSEASPTGQRYIEHASRGWRILMFARESVRDRAFWYLGTARYVSHEGERPMAVTWALDQPLSGDLYTAMAAAVA